MKQTNLLEFCQTQPLICMQLVLYTESLIVFRCMKTHTISNCIHDVFFFSTHSEAHVRLQMQTKNQHGEQQWSNWFRKFIKLLSIIYVCFTNAVWSQLFVKVPFRPRLFPILTLSRLHQYCVFPYRWKKWWNPAIFAAATCTSCTIYRYIH